MEQYLASHEVAISWAVFLCAFLLIGVAETFRPRRELQLPTGRRWIANGLLASTHMAVGAIYPVSATILAVIVTRSPYGLLNRPVVPYAIRFVLGFLFLDLAHYATHCLLHRSAWLWRIHQVHHSDPDFDLTTGVRTHPAEVLLSLGVDLAAVALLTPPPLAVVSLAVFSSLQNLFTHANLRLPAWADAALRRVLVTPDVHRIHHSDSIAEQNRNFGFVFSWWDRLFGTYLAEPAQGHEQMGVGLQGFQDARSTNIVRLLAMPLQPPVGPNTEVVESATLRATGSR